MLLNTNFYVNFFQYVPHVASLKKYKIAEVELWEVCVMEKAMITAEF